MTLKATIKKCHKTHKKLTSLQKIMSNKNITDKSQKQVCNNKDTKNTHENKQNINRSMDGVICSLKSSCSFVVKLKDLKPLMPSNPFWSSAATVLFVCFCWLLSFMGNFCVFVFVAFCLFPSLGLQMASKNVFDLLKTHHVFPVYFFFGQICGWVCFFC